MKLVFVGGADFLWAPENAFTSRDPGHPLIAPRTCNERLGGTRELELQLIPFTWHSSIRTGEDRRIRRYLHIRPSRPNNSNHILDVSA